MSGIICCPAWPGQLKVLAQTLNLMVMTPSPLTSPRRDTLASYIGSHLKVRHLEMLVALNDMGGLGRVANHLHVTQPAISKTLAALEEGMGVALFERTARGLVATETGECLVRHARAVLGELREAQHNVRAIREGRMVRTSIGTLPVAAATVMPSFIAALEARAPEVMISVREGTTDSLMTRLRAGNIDFAVSFLPEKPLDAHLAADMLVDDHMVAVVRRDHPLERCQPLAWEALMDYPLVLPPQATFTRGMIDSFWAQHGIVLPARQVESLSIMTNVGVLQSTDSVALLLGSVAQRFSALGLLSILPLDFASIHMRLSLLWRTDRELSRAHELVRQVFQQVRGKIKRAEARVGAHQSRKR